MKVLIADDNENVRKLIIKILAQLNMASSVIECGNGEDAVKKYSEAQPDIVLMDIVMDRLDGLKATQKIIQLNESAKVLIISQLPEEEYKQEALNFGAIGFLNKENLSDLPNIIERIISQNKTT